MTQTMTKEQTFIKQQGYHKNVTVILSDVECLLEEYAQQQLSAEREANKKEIERILSAFARGENLADSLNFDGKSELQKERERSGKLVEAYKSLYKAFCKLDKHLVNIGDFSCNRIIDETVRSYQQTLNEYEKEITGNQDHTNPSS